MRQEIRISGFGGQGVMLAGFLLGKAFSLYQDLEAVTPRRRREREALASRAKSGTMSQRRSALGERAAEGWENQGRRGASCSRHSLEAGHTPRPVTGFCGGTSGC